MLGHHPNRMHDINGTQMDWTTHQAIHQGESDALKGMGIRGDAFNRAWGNTSNPSNLPPRRQYGNIQGPTY